MAGIVDGNPVDASYTNSKLASKDGDNTFIGKQTLNRAGSGATITDAQQTINTLITDVATAENDILNLQNDVTTLQNLDTFIYGGVWDASTNSPTLADGDNGNGLGPGIVYRVSVSGSQNLGSGSISFVVGDKVVYNTLGVWEKWDVSDEVTSVNGKTGIVVTYDSANDNATGSNATLSAVTTTVVRLTNAGLVSIDMIPAGASAYEFVLENKTGVTITINNDTGATAANRILTGAGSAIQMLNNSSLKLVYDTTSSRWHIVGGAGGANKTLSNLDSPTAVNQNLYPSTSDTYDIGGSSNRWNGINADLYNLFDTSSAIQGRFKPTVTSPSGLTTGVQLEAVASTEPLILNTINNASGNSGTVSIESGNSTSGNSGAITLQTGTAGGTRGNIIFKDGSEGTVGHVWTSTSVNGDGEWQAASGGGANTTLSNLGTTSINSSLIPQTTLSIDLGSSGPKAFLGLYVRDIYKQDAVKIIDMLNSRILDASGNASIYYDSKYLITGPQGGPTIKLDWSGNLKAHVKIEPNATETLDLGTSSLYWNTLYITKIVVPTTVTGGGTTGNQTINKISGTVNFAAAATSLTVTNSFVAANSIVMAVVRTNDATAKIKNVVPAAGSFTINLDAAATAETSVGFFVIN